ncbi:hypothetical protein GCM10027184_72690 [Saccharothrix stipae]
MAWRTLLDLPGDQRFYCGRAFAYRLVSDLRAYRNEGGHAHCSLLGPTFVVVIDSGCCLPYRESGMSLFQRNDHVRHRLARRGRTRILLSVVAGVTAAAALITPSGAVGAADQAVASGGGSVHSFWLHISDTQTWDSSPRN